MEKNEEEIDKLAEEHWEWILQLIFKQLDVSKYLFKSGFEHGWKHAKGEKE